MKRLHATLAACAFLAACNAQAPATETAAAPAAPEVASACADDGPTLPITGLCASRAINYIDPAIGLQTTAPESCEWVMADTALPENEALVYRALVCKGVVTTLEFHGGAQSAALGYTASALTPTAVSEHEPVRIFRTDPADPQKAIRDLFPSIPEAERATCVIAPANNEFWPKDALVITPTPEARAKLPKDEPITACGPYGLDEDSQTFWRTAQGYAWFFELGQDQMEIDPGSFVVFVKGADGTWAPKP